MGMNLGFTLSVTLKSDIDPTYLTSFFLGESLPDVFRPVAFRHDFWQDEKLFAEGFYPEHLPSRAEHWGGPDLLLGERWLETTPYTIYAGEEAFDQVLKVLRDYASYRGYIWMYGKAILSLPMGNEVAPSEVFRIRFFSDIRRSEAALPILEVGVSLNSAALGGHSLHIHSPSPAFLKHLPPHIRFLAPQKWDNISVAQINFQKITNVFGKIVEQFGEKNVVSTFLEVEVFGWPERDWMVRIAEAKLPKLHVEMGS